MKQKLSFCPQSYKALKQLVSESYHDSGFVVGGAVRDLILCALRDNQEPLAFFEDLLDIDIVVEVGNRKYSDNIKSFFSDVEILDYPNFQVSSYLFSDTSRLDLCSFRKEFYAEPGSLPEVSPGSMEEDILRRDFTINSLLMSASDYVELLDEFISSRKFDITELKSRTIDKRGGVNHLIDKVLEVHHVDSFVDDPTRIIRAAKYFPLLSIESKNCYKFLGPLAKASLDRSYLINAPFSVSIERVTSEIIKLMKGKNGYQSILCLEQLGFISNFFKLTSLDNNIKKLSNFLKRPKNGMVNFNVLFWITLYYSGVDDFETLASKMGIKKKIVAQVTKVKNDIKVTELDFDLFTNFITNPRINN